MINDELKSLFDNYSPMAVDAIILMMVDTFLYIQNREICEKAV